MHDNFLALELIGGQLAGVRHEAVLPWSDRAFLLPRGEVLGLIYADRGLDPEDNLGHGHKVDLLVVLQSLIHPVEERVKESGVVL